jgi:hypothetical protein
VALVAASEAVTQQSSPTPDRSRSQDRP